MSARRQPKIQISPISHIVRKPVYAICEQQRHRSACTSTQSDQRLCCSLPRLYNSSSFYIQNFKPLPIASFCGCTGWFESYLAGNPEDRFSRDVALTILNQDRVDFSSSSQKTELWVHVCARKSAIHLILVFKFLLVSKGVCGEKS